MSFLNTRRGRTFFPTVRAESLKPILRFEIIEGHNILTLLTFARFTSSASSDVWFMFPPYLLSSKTQGFVLAAIFQQVTISFIVLKLPQRCSANNS